MTTIDASKLYPIRVIIDGNNEKVCEKIPCDGSFIAAVDKMLAHHNVVGVIRDICLIGRFSKELENHWEKYRLSMIKTTNVNKMESILFELLLFVLDNPAPSTIVLVSSDPELMRIKIALASRRYNVVTCTLETLMEFTTNNARAVKNTVNPTTGDEKQDKMVKAKKRFNKKNENKLSLGEALAFLEDDLHAEEYRNDLYKICQDLGGNENGALFCSMAIDFHKRYNHLPKGITPAILKQCIDLGWLEKEGQGTRITVYCIDEDQYHAEEDVVPMSNEPVEEKPVEQDKVVELANEIISAATDEPIKNENVNE